jgi:CubicO group peptidase (beta-lactamase class C family)
MLAMRTLPGFAASLLCLLAINTEFSHCQRNDQLRSLCKYIDFKLQRDHIPGLAACIIKNDAIVWSRGFGLQNVEERIPMTPQTVIGTASITKIVTAIAIMQLHERGKLNLDDPVNKYLSYVVRHPNYPEVDMTVSQLLSHTASTSNGPSLWRCYSCEVQPLSLGQWVRAYFLPGGKYYHKEGNFGAGKPGEEFLYSNSGYALLAYLVEVVSRVPFGQYCRENIFIPLGMSNTSLDATEIQQGTLCTTYSYGYNMDLERDLMAPNTDCAKAIAGHYLFPLCTYTTSTPGAGGMYSSIDQLAHLLIALMNNGTYEGNRILSEQSVTKILGPYVDSRKLPRQFASFGLGGYAMKLSNGALVWGHTGADAGQSSIMLFNRETAVGAIVLASRFVDIRDLIEWMFAEGIASYSSTPLDQLGGIWRRYAKDQVQREITIRVLPNYLPGGSHIYVVGNHRYLGAWMSTGIPLLPQRDRSWEKTLCFPDSTKLEFKITRGGMDKQAVTMDGKVLPNHSFVVVEDTVVNIVVEDWKDQAQQ